MLHFKNYVNVKFQFLKVIHYGIEERGVANSPTYINVNQTGNIKRVIGLYLEMSAKIYDIVSIISIVLVSQSPLHLVPTLTFTFSTHNHLYI